MLAVYDGTGQDGRNEQIFGVKYSLDVTVS